MVHTYSPSTQEIEAVGPPVQGRPKQSEPFSPKTTATEIKNKKRILVHLNAGEISALLTGTVIP